MPDGIAFNFLDVGMGDGTLVEMPPCGNGPIVLVDFGENRSRFDIPYKDALKFLVKRINEICYNRVCDPQIDHLFITHSDKDHWNKLHYLIDSFNPKLKIKKLTVGGDWEGEYRNINKTIYKKINGAVVEGKNSKTILAHSQHDVIGFPSWSYGGANIYLLSSNYPRKNSPDINNKSLVLMFEYDGRKVILPGDAGKEVEEEIVGIYDPQNPNFLQSFGLKLGHHGSDGSTCDKWIDAVKPKAIFGSADKVWGHPYCAPIKRVMAKNTLEKLGETHWFICTCPGKKNDYRNISTDLGICNNLWYAVTDPKGETKRGPDGIDHTEQQGLYTGVQWRLQIDKGVNPVLTRTDQWPAPDPNITPSFCPP